MNKPLINRSLPLLIGLSCLGSIAITPLLAQTQECQINLTGRGQLTCAYIHNIENEVFPAPYLFTTQTLETKDNAKARLQFNEGSLARIGANSKFYFAGGQQFGTVTEGTALVALLPGDAVAVNTPNAQIDQQGTVYILRYDSKKNESFIRVLGGQLTLSSRDGSQSVALKAGQSLVVEQDFLGSPQSFDLQAFYQDQESPDSELAQGFGPGQEDSMSQEPPSVKNAMSLLRTETSIALRSQTRIFPGPDFRRRFLNDALIGTHDPITGVPDDTYTNRQGVDPRLGRTAPARLQVIVLDDELSRDFDVLGQLTADGDFGFITSNVQGEGIPDNINPADFPSTDVSFNVGTTEFSINVPILITESFVDAALTNPAIQEAVLEETDGRIDFRTLDRNEALKIIQSATVTPQAIPVTTTFDSGTFVPVVRDSGIFFIGPILDR